MRLSLDSSGRRLAGALLVAIFFATTSGLTQTSAQNSGTAAPAPGTPGTVTTLPTPTPTAQATPTFTPSPTSSVPVPPILAAVASRHQARMGIYVYHFGNGQVLQLNADQRFRAASLYKLVVLFDAYQRLAAGTLRPDEVLAMSQAALDAEPYAEWPLGTRTTVACALDAMVVISSNAAAAMLLERLGGEPQVTANARSWGLTENTEITKERAFTSPRDVAHLLITIATDQSISPEAGASMRGILAAQRRNDRIPLPLPLELTVAHKTGELNRLRHDAGIVYAPSGPYLIVAMVEGAPSDAAARAAILDLSREMYGYFERTPVPSFLGLPPRLALEVLQRPDEQGRLVPLWDPDSQTIPLRDARVALAPGAEGSALREFVVPDLVALQAAATQAGSPFWVTAGYRAPRPSELRFVDPSATEPPCSVEIPARAVQGGVDIPPRVEQGSVEIPTRTERGSDEGSPAELATSRGDLISAAQATPQPTTQPALATATPVATPAVTPGQAAAAPPAPTASPGTPGPTSTPAPATVASQHWLGTTIAVTDAANRNAAEDGVEPTATARWLAANAWRYGFIPALPESPQGLRLGYEPWRYRWVGRELASQLRGAVTSGDYAGTVTAALRQAEMELVTRR